MKIKFNIIKKTIKNLTLKFKFFLTQDFFHNPIIQWIFIGTMIFNILNWVILAFFMRPLDIPIILHYNVYFGVDIIGDWWQVYLLPVVGGVFFLLNLFLAYILFQKKERIASYVLLLTSFILQISNIISSSSIIFINY